MSDQELNNKESEPKQGELTLYHYCSVETFFQIITNQTLRLTNIQYMNDSEELHYGLDQLEKIGSVFLSGGKEYRGYMCFYRF